MSLSSSLKSAVFKVGAIITKPAPIIATAVTSPGAFIKNPKEAVNKFVSQPLSTQVVKGAIAGVTLGTIAGGKTISVVKSAVSMLPKSLVGKALTIAAVPVIYGAVTANPIGAVKKTTQAGEALVDLGKTVADPSLETEKEFIEEHPYATAALAAAAAAAAAKLLLPAIVATRQTIATQEQTKAIEEYNKAVANPAAAQAPQVIIQQMPFVSEPAAAAVSTAAALPISEDTKPLIEEKKPVSVAKKKKSKAKKKKIKKKAKKKTKKRRKPRKRQKRKL